MTLFKIWFDFSLPVGHLNTLTWLMRPALVWSLFSFQEHFSLQRHAPVNTEILDHACSGFRPHLRCSFLYWKQTWNQLFLTSYFVPFSLSKSYSFSLDFTFLKKLHTWGYVYIDFRDRRRNVAPASLPSSSYISWKQPSRGMLWPMLVSLSGTDMEKRLLQALKVVLGLLRHWTHGIYYPECDLKVGEGKHRLCVGLFP